MNHVVLKGNLTADPEVKEVTAGERQTKVANFRVAVSRYFKRQDGTRDKDTTFIACEAWDTGAESIGNLLHKGDPVLLEGSLKSESWEQDGQPRSRLKVRVANFEKLNRAPKRDYGDGSEDSSQDESTANVTDEKEVVGAGATAEGGGDIPF